MSEQNEAAERLWLRVNQPDVPIEIAPMLRDVLRWGEIERRATLERIREAIGPELEVPEHETVYAAYERTGHNVLLREVRAILDEEAAR